MKNFKYTALIIGLVISFQNLSHNQIVTIDDLETIQKKSKYRLTLAISLLTIAGYYNYQNIISCYQAHPYVSAILSYLIATFMIDTYVQYKTINQNLFLLQIIDQIYQYLKSALLIEPDREKCFRLIEAYSNFSIDEIEKITQETICHSLKCINCTSICQLQYQSPNIHQLTCTTINLYEVIADLKDDTEMYQELLHLKKNELIDKEKMLKNIGQKINKDINVLINNKIFRNEKGT